MKDKTYIFRLTGIGLLFIILLISMMAFAEFHLGSIPVILFHWRSVVIILIGLIVSFFIPSQFRFAEAVLCCISLKNRTGDRDLIKNSEALVRASYMIWIFAVGGAVFNFVFHIHNSSGTPNNFLVAFRFAAYPVAYGIILGNLLLLNMATFLRKTHLEMLDGPRCFTCGEKLSGEKELCPECDHKEKRSQEKGVRVLKLMDVIIRGISAILLILTFVYHNLTFYNISLFLVLYFFAMYFVSLERAFSIKREGKAIVPFLFLVALSFAFAGGDFRLIIQGLSMSLFLILSFSIIVGLVKPEIVLFGKSRSRILVVITYFVLFIFVVVIGSSMPGFEEGMATLSKRQNAMKLQLQQRQELKQHQKSE